MGSCLGRSSGFKLSDKLGQDKMAAEFFKIIGLEKYDVSTFYSIFSEFDLMDLGYFETSKIYAIYRLSKNEFTQRLLHAGINKNKDILNFTDFIAILWNFLTTDESLLPGLVYYLFDDNKDDALDFAEIRNVVECIHQKSYNNSTIVRDIVDDMQHSHAQISRKLFSSICRKNHNICSPIISIQFNLRKKIVGDFFWSRITDKRLLDKQKCQPDFVYKSLERCEVKRETLRRERRLQEFRQMKYSMLSEKKNKEQRDKEAGMSKFDRLREKKEAEAAAKGVNKQSGALNEVVTANEKAVEKTVESVAGHRDAKSPKQHMKGLSMTTLAATKFKAGIKVAPGAAKQDAGGGEQAQRQKSNKNLSQSKATTSDAGGRNLVRSTSSKRVMTVDRDDEGGDGDGDGGGGGQATGGAAVLTRGSSKSKLRSKTIVGSDRDAPVGGARVLKRSNSSRKGLNSEDDDGGDGRGRRGSLRRSDSSRKRLNSEDNAGEASDGRGSLKRSNSSRKRLNSGGGSDHEEGGGAGSRGAVLLTRNSSKKLNVEDMDDSKRGGDGGKKLARSDSDRKLAEGASGSRRKLEPLKLDPIMKKQSKSRKKKQPQAAV